MAQSTNTSQPQDANIALGEEGPIVVKGGSSVEIKFKNSDFPDDPNDKEKHYGAKKELTRLLVNGTLVKTLDKNDKIEIYYKAIP